MTRARIVLFGASTAGLLGCTQVHLLGQVDSNAEETTGETAEETTGETAEETTGETAEETDGEDPDVEACALLDLEGTPGLTVEIQDAGGSASQPCKTVTLTNQTEAHTVWTQDLRVGGELINCWNAERELLGGSDWRFRGLVSANNVVVLAGNSVDFGCCLACEPDS